jgi:hypothetical protein
MNGASLPLPKSCKWTDWRAFDFLVTAGLPINFRAHFLLEPAYFLDFLDFRQFSKK